MSGSSNSADSPAIYYDIVAGSQEQTNRDRTFVVEEDGDGGALVKYGGSRQLDYEQLKSYNITVRATVSGRDQRRPRDFALWGQPSVGPG